MHSYKKDRKCDTCNTIIWDTNKSTGLCKKCWSKKRKHSEETKVKLSQSATRRFSDSTERARQSILKSNYIKEHGHNKGMLGKKHTPETLRKFSEMRKGKLTGSDNPAWNGGTTTKLQKLRSSKAYKRWRKAIFERDDYTCQFCSIRGGVLNADHIKPIKLNPELALDLSNGRTLCIDCHKTTDSYGWKARSLAL